MSSAHFLLLRDQTQINSIISVVFKTEILIENQTLRDIEKTDDILKR